MFSALKLVAGGAVLALFGGLLLTVGVLGPADDPTVPAAPAANEDVSPSSGTDGFPTGLFVSPNLDDWFMEYNEDGTARVFIHGANVQVDFEYTVEGDLMTEALDLDDGEPDMTYRWDYDGEILTMDPLGEVSETHPSKVAGRGWRLVPDPAEIVVAAEEVEAGGMVYSTWAVIGIVPGAEAPPDVYLDVADVIGRIAAVPITPGQPITPDMLEPTE